MILITTSDIAYTIAIVENSYEYWDQWFALKNMTYIAHKTYLESKGYMEKKPYLKKLAGRWRQYCGMV